MTERPQLDFKATCPACPAMAGLDPTTAHARGEVRVRGTTDGLGMEVCDQSGGGRYLAAKSPAICEAIAGVGNGDRTAAAVAAANISIRACTKPIGNGRQRSCGAGLKD